MSVDQFWRSVSREIVSPYFTRYSAPWRESAETAARDLYAIVDRFDAEVIGANVEPKWSKRRWRAVVIVSFP